MSVCECLSHSLLTRIKTFMSAGGGGQKGLEWGELSQPMSHWINNSYVFQKLSNSTFDLVLSFNPWGFYLGELFDCPVVVFSPPGAFPTHTQLIGNPFNPSYQPVITSDLSGKGWHQKTVFLMVRPLRLRYPLLDLREDTHKKSFFLVVGPLRFYPPYTMA